MSKTARKTIVIAILTILVMSFSVVGFTACGERETGYVDIIGRNLDIEPGTYQRVVCIGAGALRLYSYIGDLNLLVGIEDIDNTTREERPKMFDAAARPYILAYKDIFNSIEKSCGFGGPNNQEAEKELILKCEPDIIISEYKDGADSLQAALGVPVVVVDIGPDGVFSDDFKKSMTLLGRIFGKEDRAAEINKFVAKEKQLIANRTKKIKEADKKCVYICGLGNWGTTNQYMTAQNYAPFKIANVKNAVSGLAKDGIQKIEADKLVDIGETVDIMIVDAAAVKNIKPLSTKDGGRELERLQAIKAWQNGEVYLEMPYNVYYTNCEIAIVNTWWIAKVAYPELFADIDMTQKTNEVMRVFFGKDLATEIFACPASFGGYKKIANLSEFFG